MGFISWQTADTKESIANIYTGQCKPVYLLQPNGKPPIYEPEYKGYGVFGEKDAYVWLAENNLPQNVLCDFSEEALWDMGIDLYFDGHCEDIIKEVKYPLKFSFDKNAVYENLPASESCPYQGFFSNEDKKSNEELLFTPHTHNEKDELLDVALSMDDIFLVFEYKEHGLETICMACKGNNDNLTIRTFIYDDDECTITIWDELEKEINQYATYEEKIDALSDFVNNSYNVNDVQKDVYGLYQHNDDSPTIG